MRKTFCKLTILFIALLIVVLLFRSNDADATLVDYEKNIDLIYSKPTTSPKNKSLEVKASLDFTIGSFDWHENDDWDWDTLASEYGYINEDNADRKFYLIPAGGKYHPSFEFWVKGKSIEGNSGFMYSVDFTNLVDSTNIKTKLRVSTSTTGTIGNVGDLTKNEPIAKSVSYYYDYNLGEWKSVVSDSEGYMSLPDSYRGYIYMPMSCYSGLDNNGVGASGNYVQMYHLDFSVADNTESTNPIYFDEIEMVSEKTEHIHSFALDKVVAPTCENNGLSLMKCSCGQTKWENVSSKVEHTVGEKYACNENLAAALCSSCESLVYYNEKCDKTLTDGVTITYEYNVLDLETESRVYPIGYTLKSNDIPFKYYVSEGFDGWQFFRYTTDSKQMNGLNPLGLTVEEDMTLYAQYNIATYDGEKYRAMRSIVSFNGGPYNEKNHFNKIIFTGHSNFSLWHNMEGWYATKGLSVLNNSVAGSTSHNYNEYLEELVLMYRPEIVVTILSSNDLAYHNMTDKQILENMEKMYLRINEELPDTKVFICAMNPLPGRIEYLNTIKRVNQKTEALCEKYDNLYYINIFPKMYQYALQYPEGWDTWTHLHQSELESVFGDIVYATISQYVN